MPFKTACASPHPLATSTAMAMMAEGGNAIDAAVAAAAMLSVVAPHDCGLGGDLFALVTEPGREPRGLDASGLAPQAASADLYIAAGLQEVPLYGPLSVTTPGAVSGWAALMERYGSLPLSLLMAPAIAAAREGVVIDPSLSGALTECRELLARSAAAKAIFADATTAPVLRQHDLADTLEQLAEAGLIDFYRGEVARRLIAGLSGTGTLLTLEDLLAQRPI